MNAKTLTKTGLVLFVVLSLVDLCTTFVLIQGGGGKIEEGNPFARAWLLRYGWEGMVIFKMGAMLVVASVVLLLVRYRPLVGAFVVTFACLAVGSVSIYSYHLLKAAFP
jgi:hypothetical protein